MTSDVSLGEVSMDSLLSDHRSAQTRDPLRRLRSAFSQTAWAKLATARIRGSVGQRPGGGGKSREHADKWRCRLLRRKPRSLRDSTAAVAYTQAVGASEARRRSHSERSKLAKRCFVIDLLLDSTTE